MFSDKKSMLDFVNKYYILLDIPVNPCFDNVIY